MSKADRLLIFIGKRHTSSGWRVSFLSPQPCVVACAAERREHGFRVTFTDNRKVYVAPKPNSNYDFLLGRENMYRSYLSLMPDGEENETQNQLLEERRAILEQFSKLSGREQELQRRSWTDELSTVLDEVLTKYFWSSHTSLKL